MQLTAADVIEVNNCLYNIFVITIIQVFNRVLYLPITEFMLTLKFIYECQYEYFFTCITVLVT